MSVVKVEAPLLIPNFAIHLLAYRRTSLAGNWIFPFHRWLDPNGPDDYRALCPNYGRICGEIQEFKACRDVLSKLAMA